MFSQFQHLDILTISLTKIHAYINNNITYKQEVKATRHTCE